MSLPSRTRTALRPLSLAALPATLAIAVAAVPAADAATPTRPAADRGHAAHGHARPDRGRDHGRPDHGRRNRRPVVDAQLLAFNDFHGNLEPPTGANGQLAGRDGQPVTVGGAEYLATHLQRLRARNRNTLTVAGGDLIGASPFLSSVFHDEPAVESLNAMDLDVSSVGNHEFDRGIDELRRIQDGGCFAGEDCEARGGFAGAAYRYLGANVLSEETGDPVLPPTWVRRVRGIPVGFIGLTLEGTSTLVSASGIKGLRFADEVETANAAAAMLKRRGVRAIVVLIHQGGITDGNPDECGKGTVDGGLQGDIVDIAKRVDPAIDALVTAHTHWAYRCRIADPAGKPRWVTSAGSFGRAITKIDLPLSRRTKDVVRDGVRTETVLVTRDVPKDPVQTANIAKWKPLSAERGGRIVGSVSAPVTRAVGGARDADSSLGYLVADAQLEASRGDGAVAAFMNPGGLRDDLQFAPSADEQPGEVTYGEAYAVQPFGNLLVSMDLTGAQIDTLLEQQFATQTDGSVRRLALGVAGITYGWSAAAPVGTKVDPASVRIGGQPLDLAATYRITVNSFLSDGGDGFSVLKDGRNKVIGDHDLDALIAYLGAHAPVAPPAIDRSTRLP